MPSSSRVNRLLRLHAANCLECGRCVRECGFLQQYGSPKAIAASWQPDTSSGQRLPFNCSLCGLCAAVCPPGIGLNPAAMFLAMRRQVVQNGAAPFPEHRRLLAYERRSVSSRYSCFALPENCDTVLFPGCAFAGTRPARLMELFRHLRPKIPGLGIVLSCCAKPSHNLGRQDFFMNKFGALQQKLIYRGVRRVLVLCPSCHTVFSRYGSPLHTEYVYTLLAEHPLPKQYRINKNRKVTVHDPCTTRQDSRIHETVRRILGAVAARVEEPACTREKTICCGEGGAVSFFDKKLARNWGNRRCQETQGQITVTYCAGCVDFLRSRMRIIHLLDLLFAPEAALAGKLNIARPPFTYLNRLLLKRRLKKMPL